MNLMIPGFQEKFVEKCSSWSEEKNLSASHNKWNTFLLRIFTTERYSQMQNMLKSENMKHQFLGVFTRSIPCLEGETGIDPH